MNEPKLKSDADPNGIGIGIGIELISYATE
jgi:hypothetical protein